MSYTLSFDASLKIKKNNVKGLLNHMFRDITDTFINHSNETIDADLTCNNQSLYYNQEKQCFEKCTDISQIENSLKQRLSTVKKPLRKDAVICRGIILQLDPQWYEDNGYDPENTTNADMVQWACETFGEQNIIGLSIHEDETNPHIHILFAPVTEDGRLSQKDWFKNPASLRQMHEDFKKHMKQKGYDISFDKQPKRKHMSVDEYKTFKEAEDKVSELREWEKDLKLRNNKLTREETALKAQISDFENEKQQYTENIKETLKNASTLLNDIVKIHQQTMSMCKGYQESYNSTFTQKRIDEQQKKLDEAYRKIENNHRSEGLGYV